MILLLVAVTLLRNDEGQADHFGRAAEEMSVTDQVFWSNPVWSANRGVGLLTSACGGGDAAWFNHTRIVLQSSQKA